MFNSLKSVVCKTTILLALGVGFLPLTAHSRVDNAEDCRAAGGSWVSNGDTGFCYMKLEAERRELNEEDMIAIVSRVADISHYEAEQAVRVMSLAMGKALKKGDSISLVGFGSFSVSKSSNRTGRNPQTGKEIKIPAVLATTPEGDKVLNIIKDVR